MAKYYFETKTILREATPEEEAILDFTLEVGDTVTFMSDTFGKVLDKNLEEVKTYVANSVWSGWASIIKSMGGPKEGVLLESQYYEIYKGASSAQKELFWRWIHGEYHLPEPLCNQVTGQQEMLIMLGYYEDYRV